MPLVRVAQAAVLSRARLCSLEIHRRGKIEIALVREVLATPRNGVSQLILGYRGNGYQTSSHGALDCDDSLDRHHPELFYLRAFLRSY
jgi:hypothetical protein